MTETQKRIKAYQKALPGMKERVSAVAMLLIVSISMMTSATFAWMTLSRNPEISSIATTVTTNGNLEIALSGPKGLEPAETTVSDGGQDVVSSNLTWGNLINLSDASYGLSGIALRPASLNTNKLNSSPVYATEYGSDGRVEGYITDFAFTNYDKNANKFIVQTDGMSYGVRAVSSVTYDGDPYSDVFFTNQLATIDSLYRQACEDFEKLYSNGTYMDVVYRLVQEYANQTLGNDAEDISEDMDDLMLMMNDLVAVVDVLGNAYVEMANLEQYRNEGAEQYDPYDLQDLIDETIDAGHLDKLTYYTKYQSMRKQTIIAYNGIKAKADLAEQNQAVYFDDIRDPVNKLCNMSTATVQGYDIGYISTHKSELAGDILKWDEVPAVINDGVLKDLDQFLAGTFFVPSDPNRSVTVKVVITKTLHPYVYTAAYQSNNSYAIADYNATEAAASEGSTSQRKVASAAETYAMALDLWVRTNEDDALLILEGEYVTETRTVTGTDSEGNVVDYYIYTYTDSEDQKQELTVYKLTEGGTDTWYVAESHQELTTVVDAVTITEENPALKTEEVIIGYEGVNRVWDELDDPNNAAVMIPGGKSTTQGSGSCYIFYPESPEDQAQGLKLLSAMRVAFMDAEGKLLATAYMDTTNAIENSGRVIVPLRLYANVSISVGANGKSEEFYITPLTQNEATRITALIYLEGKGLENSDVLAAGSITGQMNIQFGTNVSKLEPVDDNELMQSYYNIDRVYPGGSAASPFTFGDGEAWETELKMMIDGITPSSVKGNFISVINATQGARQGEFIMELNKDSGYWEAYTYRKDAEGNVTKKLGVFFDAPGNYQLRSLQIDGVDYALDAEDIVYIKVPGMGISSVSWDAGTTENLKTVWTADSSSQQTLTLRLGSDDNKIHTVQGVFLGDAGKNVTVNFLPTDDGMTYVGTATFNSSGTYEMTYVYVDGVITALDDSQYKTLDISLGLKAEVRLSTPRFADENADDIPDFADVNNNGVLEPEEEDAINRVLSELTFTPGVGYSFIYTGEEMLYFDIVCTITDDMDKPVEGLPEIITLYYGQGTTANALYTELEWDGKAYTDTFDFQKFGIFDFNYVQLGPTNFITKGSAHSITAIPAAPMQYLGNDLPDSGFVFDLGGARTVSLSLANAEAAKLKMTMDYTNGAGETSEVIFDADDYQTNTNEDGVTTFTFTLPGDGLWEIKDIKAGTVFYKEEGSETGTFYSGDDSDESTWLDLMDLMSDDENQSVKFVTEVKSVVLNTTGTDDEGVFDLGSKNIGSTFVFGESGRSMSVSFLAYDGKNIAEHADRALTAKVQDGGYFWSKNTVEASATPASVQITGEADIDKNNSVLNLTVGDFTVDGIWSVAEKGVTVTLSDGDSTKEEITIPKSSLPQIKVTWNAPTVKISAVSPTGAVNAYVSHSRSGFLNRNVTIQTTSYTAGKNEAGTIANVCYIGTKADYGLASFCNLTQPSVTITLEGMGTAKNATLTFKKSDGTTGLLYDGQTAAQYSWSADDTCTRNVGTFNSVSGGDDSRTIAGTITAKEIVLTVNVNGVDKQFTIGLGNNYLTINNPY